MERKARVFHSWKKNKIRLAASAEIPHHKAESSPYCFVVCFFLRSSCCIFFCTLESHAAGPGAWPCTPGAFRCCLTSFSTLLKSYSPLPSKSCYPPLAAPRSWRGFGHHSVGLTPAAPTGKKHTSYREGNAPGTRGCLWPADGIQGSNHHCQWS